MKPEIIKKLKAFITDSSASEGEQQNAIRFLLAYKAKGYDVGEIPEPVRPKKDKKPKYEKIEVRLQVYERVFTSIKEIKYHVYLSKKIPYERVKKSSFNLPMSISEKDSMPGMFTVEKERIYKTKFYLYEELHIRFDKVGVDDFIIKEKGQEYHVDSKLLKESDEYFDGKELWHESAFNEYENGTYAIKINLNN